MKQDVLDVLMYLFETYMTDEGAENEPDRSALKGELERAGFHIREIDRALDWLDGLTDGPDISRLRAPTARATRIFNDVERAHLDIHAQGYIIYLEQIGILSAEQRELLIDRLMALGTDEVDIEQIKWVVLMVLFSQPGQETAYARMEDLVFDENPGLLH
jgi:Smg protein